MCIRDSYEGQRVHVGSRRMMDAKKLLVDEINEPGTVVYVCVGREYAGYVLVQDQVKDCLLYTSSAIRCEKLR